MNILFVTFDKCPNVDAGALRIHSLSKAFVDHAHDVTVISMGPYNNFKALVVEGIRYISLRPLKQDSISKAIAYALFHIKLRHILNSCNFDVCFHTQIDKASLNVLKHYFLEHSRNLVYDAVEWYSPEQFKLGKFSPAYRRNYILNAHHISKGYKVISISRFFHTYFTSKGIQSLLMPVVLDIEKIPYDKIKHDKINILYAGMPGKKDYLDTMIKAISLLEEDERAKLHFKIIGCNKSQFDFHTLISLDDLKRIEDCVEFVGRVSRNAVLSEYCMADFSVLIRSETARYAKAGFPTKLVESLSTATPVICNYTSDIDLYVKHLENGIVLEGNHVDACLKALRCVLSLNKSDIIYMQYNARKTAETSFDYRLYSDILLDFILR